MLVGKIYNIIIILLICNAKKKKILYYYSNITPVILVVWGRWIGLNNNTILKISFTSVTVNRVKVLYGLASMIL